MGKTIVATNYPTVGEVLTDHQNGLICEMSGQAIADAVEELILHPDLMQRLAAACAAQTAENEDPNSLFYTL